MNNEKHYEEEFDHLYAEGKVGEGVLDDSLPDYRDNWIAERMGEDENPLNGVEVEMQPKGIAENIMEAVIYGKKL